MFSLISTSKHEKGQGLVEYAILLALIATLVIGTMTTLGNKNCNTFNSINNSLPNSGTPSSTGCKAAGTNQTTYTSEDAAIAAICSGKPKNTKYYMYVKEVGNTETFIPSLTKLSPVPLGYSLDGSDKC